MAAEQPPEQIQSELENFREQWKAEVSARTRNPLSSQQKQHRAAGQAGPSSTSNRPPKKPEASHKKTASKAVAQLDDDEEYVAAKSFDEPDTSKARGGQRLDGQDAITQDKENEPKTALDFYEHAVERETTGKLGDSVQLYRKAFRMDHRVDVSYRDKHFPGRWKPAQNILSNVPVTVANTAHHSLEGPTLSLPDLIASFAGLKIEGVPPECEGMAPPPCPIGELPDEILLHILRDVAVADVGDFVRLSQVCKRLAYLVATEDQIWRRVCVGPEFGFGGMHYHWQSEYSWEPLDLSQVLGSEDDDVFTLAELSQRRQAASLATTNALLHSLYRSSWQNMFRRRPRVRFNGCYISTVNYIRPGQSSGHSITWSNPVHIVTYYRYLRFFRDGTAISLTTVEEPAHVVHHLTKENVVQHRKGVAPHLPSGVMSEALKGRWRLSSSLDYDGEDERPELDEIEGGLFVETEGVNDKYMYRMELSLKNARKAARNNKVVWKGFWSYNKLTDDWAAFTLKNDKPFFFSRVKSYGVGE